MLLRPLQALASFELHPRYDAGESPYGEEEVGPRGGTGGAGAKPAPPCGVRVCVVCVRACVRACVRVARGAVVCSGMHPCSPGVRRVLMRVSTHTAGRQGMHPWRLPLGRQPDVAR